MLHSSYKPHFTFINFTAMSSHLLLFLFLVALYPHACNARHHGLLHKTSFKGADKVKFSKTRLQKPMFHEQSHQHKQPTQTVGANTQKPKDYSEPLPRFKVETRGMTQRVVRIQKIVTVSWKVPHEKHAGDPRFDLDYAPPRTHPPSHN